MNNQELKKKAEEWVNNFTYGNAWWKNKQPEMYIGMVRRDMEEHTCPICGCRVDASTWEDYRMCERCHEREYDD